MVMNNIHRHSNKKRYSISLFFLFCCFAFFLIDGKGNTNPRLLQQPPTSKLICKEFSSPFNDSNRKSFGSVTRRLIGSYGEYRKSYKPGHLHAGIDLKGSFRETVCAIGCGQVYLNFRDFPHRTVIVKHHLPDGHLLFSVYTHVEQVEVNIGDWVDEQTPLARLFNEDELKRANFGTSNHLHLEIRKSMADGGRASYASMTTQELDKFCMDPIEFFKTYLEN
jgi:murein DD-endopeptidase MepM/ murein hydrolase activator NlpD